ncbi:MAG TPA: hypothetical protein VJH95_04285 [Candidatus Nanoarchaeia archaeon]|nr:hypothetical protein [Candidatus Nanoarchaeia archaeon]
MPFGLEDLGILVLGIVLGYILGEMLKGIGNKTARVTGTILVGVLNFSATLLKETPRYLPIIGWGIFFGLAVSLIISKD